MSELAVGIMSDEAETEDGLSSWEETEGELWSLASFSEAALIWGLEGEEKEHDFFLLSSLPVLPPSVLRGSFIKLGTNPNSF